MQMGRTRSIVFGPKRGVPAGGRGLTLGHGTGGGSIRSLIAGSRLHFDNMGTPTAGAYTNGANSIVVSSPPWDIVAPQWAFTAFYGKTGAGEQALGNDIYYEASYIEIAGVKNWVSFDGSRTKQTTTPSVGGAFSKNVLNGGHAWVDPVDSILVPANSKVRLGWADLMASTASLVRGGGPVVVGTAQFAADNGAGDYGSRGTGGSRLASLAADTTGNQTLSNTGSNHINAPVCLIGKPADAAAWALAMQYGAALIVGMSIDWGANDNTSPWGLTAAYMMAQGGLARGLSLPTNGRIPYCNMAVPGTRIRDLLNAGGPGGAASGEAGWAMRDAMFAAVNYPWTVSLPGGPINDSASYSAAQTQANIVEAMGAHKARGGHRNVMTTLRPQATGTEEPAGTANGFWFTGGDAHQQKASDATHVAVDAFIMSVPTGVDAVIDIRPALESSTGSRKWKEGTPTTLAADFVGVVTGVVGGTGGVSSNQLVVTTAGDKAIAFGHRVQGAGLSNSIFVWITGQVSGTAGGIGVYSLSQAVTFAAGTAITIPGGFFIDTVDQLEGGEHIVIAPQLTVGNSSPTTVNSTTGSGPYRSMLRGTVAKGYAAGATVAVQYTVDGTHEAHQGAVAVAAVIAANKAALRG